MREIGGQSWRYQTSADNPTKHQTGLVESRLSLFQKTILENRWIPKTHCPTEKQATFLMLMGREAFYGGAGGGGKTEALLMAALQFAEVPGYTAILFRRTYRDLALPNAIMDRADQWLRGTSAKWNGADYVWTFPSGARLCFGYLADERDKYRYQSAEFQFIGFDELTEFSESQYRFLFSRLRRLKGVETPLRMRGGSNPVGMGHDWVKLRFVSPGSRDRPFIRACLSDNPYLDQEAYRRSLQELDPITRRQILEGDWTARQGGSIFRREWFQIVDEAPREASKTRYWDIASTAPRSGTDPDYSCGVLVSELNGIYHVLDVRRARGTPAQVEDLIKQTAELDGPEVPIWIEEEPGSAGVSMIDHYQREVLKGFAVRGDRVTGDKQVRANPVSSAAEAGNIRILRGSWSISEFLDELEGFPEVSHDDQVDALSGAISKLVFSSYKPNVSTETVKR